MKEQRVSGNIWVKPDDFEKSGEAYVIRNPYTGQGWGLPVSHVEPKDLRALADRIEEKRSK